MIISDINLLNELIATSRNSNHHLFHDYNDPEIDKHFTSSPPITDDLFFLAENDHNIKNKSKSPRKSVHANVDTINERKPLSSSTNSIPISNSKHFISMPVPSKPVTVTKSGLSQALTTTNSSSSGISSSASSGGVEQGKLKLTMYLPDCNPMSVMVNENDTFDSILKKSLRTHRDEKRQPILQYAQPEIYEIRMHEGDGEPDRDFAALDRQKALKQFNEKEFCLCLREGAAGRSSVGGRSSMGGAGSADSSMVTVIIPNVGQVTVPFEEGAVLRDLLTMVAEDLSASGHKLRLHTDEFVFVIPAEDLAAGKLMSSYLPLDTMIAPLPTRRFELQKRIFADGVRTVRHIASKASTQRLDTNPNSVIYTDASASVYQEWNIIKKNKWGNKQERILGIDGKRVYNARRGERRVVGGGVARAQRDLNSVRKFELVESDVEKKSFRITWEEDGKTEPHDIEYICESSKDCSEILGKLSYLRSRKI